MSVMVVKMGSTRHLDFSDFSDRGIDHSFILGYRTCRRVAGQRKICTGEDTYPKVF